MAKTKLDIHAILKKAGYSDRADFGQIARWTAMQQFKSEDAALSGISQKFGPARPRPVVGMNETPAPFKTYLPGGLTVNARGEINTPYEQVMERYPDPAQYYEMKSQTEGALMQLISALRVPVAVSGATMPDVHVGYSLPIGGVVALDNAVSPAFVGYDIACRMNLTLFRPEALDPNLLADKSEREHFRDVILASSSFGVGATRAKRLDHPVMRSKTWDEVPSLRGLKRLAYEQLGTQGSGNHFCDLVELEIIAEHPGLPPVGTCLVALMTHSGSRGVGNKMGHYYADVAEKETAAHGFKVERGYGFLLLDTEAGQEYWKVMELMGEYAQANHQIVHAEFARNAGLAGAILIQYENHHNYAWHENGTVVHRKGATPAGAGQIGIIPGSSGTTSYLVEGLGDPGSLYSASHGAGRPHSRSRSKELYDEKAFTRHMREMGITYYGIAPDETLAAYKNIEDVMAAQSSMVRPLARMRPRVVVMGGNTHSDDGD